jgi:hypothetical protein
LRQVVLAGSSRRDKVIDLINGEGRTNSEEMSWRRKGQSLPRSV